MNMIECILIHRIDNLRKLLTLRYQIRIQHQIRVQADHFEILNKNTASNNNTGNQNLEISCNYTSSKGQKIPIFMSK